MLDLILRGGSVFEGTLSPPRKMDIGISENSIKVLGDLQDHQAVEDINIENLAVAPGFIDIYSHTDRRVFDTPDAESKIHQGVTTEVVGHRGCSPAPRAEEAKFGEEQTKFEEDFSRVFRAYDTYIDELDKLNMTTNLVPLIGHSTMRKRIMGYTQAPPNRREMKQMKEMLQEAFDLGARGMSVCSISAPGTYAEHDELVDLASIVAASGGIYGTCVCGEGEKVVQEVRDAVEVGTEAECKVQIFLFELPRHQTATRIHRIIEIIEQARTRGVDVVLHTHPYAGSCTNLTSLLPPWVLAGGRDHFRERLGDDTVKTVIQRQMEQGMGDWTSGYKKVGWDRIIFTGPAEADDILGSSISELAQDSGEGPFDVFFSVLLDYEDRTQVLWLNENRQDDVELVKHPACLIGSDAPAVKVSKKSLNWLNPGSFGTFPRLFQKYVYEEQILTLREAVHKITLLPATRLGLNDRGIIRPGKIADLVVFNPEKMKSSATYEQPNQLPSGVEHVFVAGQKVLHDGEMTNNLAGELVRSKEMFSESS